MWRRPFVTIRILVIPMILTLPLRAQQRHVGPSGAGPRPNAVRPYAACAAAMPALPPRAQQRPFTQEQVVSMVRDGFGDESGAKLIEQRGIDFAPSEDFYQTLKAAVASEAFLNALRAAVAPGLSSAHADVAASLPRHGGVKPPLRPADLKVSATTAASEPASAKKPLNQVQVFALLVGQVPSHRVSMLVQERGIDLEPTDDYLQEVRLAGGEDELITALKSAKITMPELADPALHAGQVEVRQHAVRRG